MKAHNRIDWTPAEIAILREHYADRGPQACLAMMPGRKGRSMRAFAASLGLRFNKLPDKEHFESKFRVTPGCWVWERGVSKDGYGQFRARGQSWRAHRFSYALYVGPIPHGLFVCHRCDNPRCVNPDHLWLGTTQDNTADKCAKGRTARNYGQDGNPQVGVTNGNAKLNDDQVRVIRSDTRTQKEIAADFDISASTVSLIKSGKHWRHVL